jgi:hypothetical protein
MKQESRIARPYGGENYAIYIPSHISMHSICMFSHKTVYEVYHSICIRGYQHILILLQNIYFQYGQKYPKDFEHENKRKRPRRLRSLGGQQVRNDVRQMDRSIWEEMGRVVLGRQGQIAREAWLLGEIKVAMSKGEGGTNNSNFCCMCNTLIAVTE